MLSSLGFPLAIYFISFEFLMDLNTRRKLSHGQRRTTLALDWLNRNFI